MRLLEFPKQIFGKIKHVKMPFSKSQKSDSDKIVQFKVKGNVDGLSKIFTSSKKFEERMEIVKALVEIGSADALVALHGFSNMPTEPSLHDEIKLQLSRGMESFLQSQSLSKNSVLNAGANKKRASLFARLNVFGLFKKIRSKPPKSDLKIEPATGKSRFGFFKKIRFRSPKSMPNVEPKLESTMPTPTTQKSRFGFLKKITGLLKKLRLSKKSKNQQPN